jgi:hypothetical protein
MVNLLRDHRSPQDLAASGQVIEFNEKLSDFSGLAEIVDADLSALGADKLPPNWRESAVTGLLSFGFADGQSPLPTLVGRLAVTIDAVCQRCLEPFRLPVIADVELVFDDGRTAAGKDSSFEVWELAEETVRPLDIVEEILIMALPFAAMHPDVNCAGQVADIVEELQTTKPFANLKSQMRDEH